MDVCQAPAPRSATGVEVGLTTRSMGGALQVRVACAHHEADRAERDLRRVADRIDAWARRLTRFDAASDLSMLNAEPDACRVPLRPTVAGVLTHAREMTLTTEGTVDVTMLAERLAAETSDWPDPGPRDAWSLDGHGRRRVLVRQAPARFDLDGVAKGWVADRALRLLDAYPGALVDADGDVAMRAPGASGWHVAVGDPLDEDEELATLGVPDGWASDRLGIATSGTSVHRWEGPAGPTHHLIDPLTGRSAMTDVVQATVVARNAAEAECLAKSAVIRGSVEGLDLLERAGAWAVVLLLESGDVVTSRGTSGWLA